jgi:hypothetical protein
MLSHGLAGRATAARRDDKPSLRGLNGVLPARARIRHADRRNGRRDRRHGPGIHLDVREEAADNGRGTNTQGERRPGTSHLRVGGGRDNRAENKSAALDDKAPEKLGTRPRPALTRRPDLLSEPQHSDSQPAD